MPGFLFPFFFFLLKNMKYLSVFILNRLPSEHANVFPRRRRSSVVCCSQVVDPHEMRALKGRRAGGFAQVRSN